MASYDIAIIGGGILGVAVSYYLAHLNPDASIVVIEREDGVARHASGRNTGKVHAPYLYNPAKKRLLARAAFAGYDMWRTYANQRALPFKADGVAEVALDSGQIEILERYRKWGLLNGLLESDMEIIDGGQFHRREPEVVCDAALVCKRDASVDYYSMTESLMRDAAAAGASFVFEREAVSFDVRDYGVEITTPGGGSLQVGFVINAGGGQAIDIAHRCGVARQYTDVHFRGEYWRAPPEYRGLTASSIYSVPRYPEYPFLDPHWIVRVDGSCEIGPGAVPVFSPYGYDAAENIRQFIPKTMEMIASGALRIPLDPRFRELVASEVWSAISKEAMIDRVRRFIPRLNHSRFTQRGIAGIRSMVVDAEGRFAPDAMICEGPRSVHVLNYNSPGATGVLPFAAYLVDEISAAGLFKNALDDCQCGPWRFSEIVDSIRS